MGGSSKRLHFFFADFLMDEVSATRANVNDLGPFLHFFGKGKRRLGLFKLLFVDVFCAVCTIHNALLGYFNLNLRFS